MSSVVVTGTRPERLLQNRTLDSFPLGVPTTTPNFHYLNRHPHHRAPQTMIRVPGVYKCTLVRTHYNFGVWLPQPQIIANDLKAQPGPAQVLGSNRAGFLGLSTPNPNQIMDYSGLKKRLERIGQFYATPPATHAFNPTEDQKALMRQAEEAAVLLGLHDQCASCGGEGVRYGIESGPSRAPCTYCNGTGTQSAGSDTPAIDRLALNDIGPVPEECSECEGRGGDTFDVYDPETGVCDYDVIPCASCGSTGTSYALPAAPCETCGGRGEVYPSYEAPMTCNRCWGSGKDNEGRPAHEWQPCD